MMVMVVASFFPISPITITMGLVSMTLGGRRYSFFSSLLVFEAQS